MQCFYMADKNNNVEQKNWPLNGKLGILAIVAISVSIRLSAPWKDGGWLVCWSMASHHDSC